MGPGPASRACAILLGAVVALGAAVAEGAVTCQESAGPPGQQTTLRIDILDPAPSATIPPSAPCGQDVLVTGTLSVTGPSTSFDIYLLVDGSASTGGDSGTDVDGDGALGGFGDSIYQAEIAAAQQFLGALDPAHVRVAVIRFNARATLEHPLSANLGSVAATLDALRARVPLSTTAYVPAMQAVEDEVLAAGSPAQRQQRCVFLSDGRQDETLAEIEVAAGELAALGVVTDTFALGFSNSQALQRIATITGGRFTHLATPGEIVSILPSFAPDPTPVLAARNDQSPVPPVVAMDPSAAFSVTVRLAPGNNHVVLTASTQGVNPVSVECAIDLFLPPGLVADAGPARAACQGESILLDGSASLTSGCASPVYRWLDCAGRPACPPSASPLCTVAACTGCGTYTLEVSCAGQPCIAASSTPATCLETPQLAPILRSSCSLLAELECGGDPALDNAWDLDARRDQDGDGNPKNDRDIAGCDVAIWFGDVGMHELVALSRSPAGCEAAADLVVTLVEPAPPREVRSRACPLAPAQLSCGVPDPAFTYWWDVATDVDADLDGDPGNDADLAGCEATASWGDEGLHEIAGWQSDAGGCVSLIVHGQVEVSDDRMPTLAPVTLASCHLAVELACGGDPAIETSWDLDAGFDTDGDGDPRNDADVTGCDVSLDFPSFGIHQLVAMARDDAGCAVAADLVVTLVEPPAPRDIRGGLCPGAVVDLSCGVPDPDAIYWWDLDGGLDSDGDGDASNDADAAGCDVTPSWGVSGIHEVACWRQDAAGCVFLVAEGALEVSASARPGETPDLRAWPDGIGVRFEWGAVPGAVDYRVARGIIATLRYIRGYDHSAILALGAGTCGTGGVTGWSDPDDAADDLSYYYLVTAVNDCAGEGTPGRAWDGRQRPERPARLPAPGCP